MFLTEFSLDLSALPNVWKHLLPTVVSPPATPLFDWQDEFVREQQAEVKENVVVTDMLIEVRAKIRMFPAKQPKKKVCG